MVKLAVALASSSAGCGGDDAGSGRLVPCEVPAGNGGPRAPLPPPLVAPCDAQGWCWESPLPFRDSLGAIWHRADQTIVASSRGHVLRLLGGAWQALPALPKPAGATGIVGIHDLWAAGDNIYVAGDVDTTGIIWSYDGAAWTAHAFERDFNPFHIWGNREREVMAVGAGGARLGSGGGWRDIPPPRLAGQGVWGCGDSYFAGLFQGNFLDEEAVIGRYRGGAWEKSSDLPEVNVQFSAISGAANDDVFASGVVNGASRNVAWHFDGSAWTDLALPDSPGLLDIAATGSGNALAIGAGADGIARVWRYDGAGWSVQAERGLLGLSAATSEDILGRSNLGVHQFDGAQWMDPFPLPLDGPLASKSLTGIWGTGATMFLIASDGSIFEHTGGGWSAMATPPAAARALNAVWGSSAIDVFAVGGRGLIWHWDGTTWSETTLPAVAGTPDLKAVWGPAGGPIYAVGSSGVIVRWDGTAWTLEDRVAEDLVGIWGTSASDIWAIGVRGRVVHFDGAAWDDSQSLTGNIASNVAGIWGSGPNQIFVVGGTTVWRYDGATWAESSLPTASPATAIWGRGAEDVFIVGGSGMAFHYDGAAWTDIRAEHAWTFHALWGDGARIRAVGDLGTISVR